MGSDKAFPKAVDLCFRQCKSLLNQNHFSDIPESARGVCSRGETGTLCFALKDVILYKLWQLLLKVPSELQARDQAGPQPPKTILLSICFTDVWLLFRSTCTKPMAHVKPSVNVGTTGGRRRAEAEQPNSPVTLITGLK